MQIQDNIRKSRVTGFDSRVLTKAVILASAVFVAAVAPYFLGAFQINLMIEVMIYGIFALGLNLLVGYTGLVSLGHAMFLGIGGYALGIFVVLLQMPFWLGLLAATITSVVTSYIIGFICTRALGAGFFILTLAVCEMIYGVAFKSKIVGGDDGMTGITRPDLGIFGLNAYDAVAFYHYNLFLFLVVLFIVWRIVHSPFGSALVGIRENERRMRALGYPVSKYKVIGFTVSGTISSFAGMMLATNYGFISPDIITWTTSGEGLLMVIVGGAHTFFGPIVGAAAYVLLRAQSAGLSDHWIMILGAFFVLAVVFFRGGIVGVLMSTYERMRA
jgi:branched-chain amino acid transport system permease protein